VYACLVGPPKAHARSPVRHLVQVINARHVTLMGRKMTDKKYYWHTNHPGGLKTRTPKQLMEKDKSEDVSGCHGR
jgi:ribosomal protein L13